MFDFPSSPTTGQTVTGANSATYRWDGAKWTAASGTTTSFATGIAAAGTTQGTATALTADVNIVTTVAANSGVVLRTATAGSQQRVLNRGANMLTVYPGSGAQIEANAANAGVSIVAGGAALFIASTATQWYVT